MILRWIDPLCADPARYASCSLVSAFRIRTAAGERCNGACDDLRLTYGDAPANERFNARSNWQLADALEMR